MPLRGAFGMMMLMAGLAVATSAAAAVPAPVADRPALEKAAQDLAADLKDLAAARDRLVASLEARMRADHAAAPPRDLLLRLDEGADHETLEMVLRQRGGRWQSARAVVPAWRHETMQEKFHFFTGSGAVRRDKFAYDVDASGLVLAGGALKGLASTTLCIDFLEEDRLPAGGKEPSWWDRFLVIGYTRPRRQSFILQAETVEGVHEFSCTLAGGVSWSGARRPIHLVFRVPAGRWDEPHVITPTWNRAVHKADVSGLRVSGGKLQGDLRVRLIPDLWVPKDQKVRTQVFKVSADLRQGRLDGTYQASGDLGDYAGRVLGTGGTLVRGGYSASGEMGLYAGKVLGQTFPALGSARGIVAPETYSRASDRGQVVLDTVAEATRVYNQVRAAHLALASYPYPLDQALDQAGAILAPDWTPAAGQALSAADLEAIVAYGASLRAAVGAAPVPGKTACVLGHPLPQDPAFGPYSDLAPLEGGAGKPNLLPPETGSDGPQRWQFIRSWRILGPLPQTDNLEFNAAEVPDLEPAQGASYKPDLAALDSLGISVPQREPMQWMAIEAPLGKARPPWDKTGVFRMWHGVVWYASAEVYSEKPQSVWLAVNANDHGKLWVNDRLVWADAEKSWAYRPLDKAVFQVPLLQGANRLLVRCRGDRTDTWFRLHVCTRGRPRAASEVAKEAPPAASPPACVGPYGDGSSTWPEARPPLAWDIQEGTNVLWRADLPAGGPQPIVVGDRLLVVAEPDTLLCFQKETGKPLWSRACGIWEVLGDKARAEYDALSDKEKDAWLGRRLGGRTDRPAGPVSDWKYVYVHYGTGLAACYDLDGNRRWVVRTYLSGAVLLVAEGGLVVEGDPTALWTLGGPPAAPPAGGKGKARGQEEHALVGLDPATGARRWAAAVPGRLQAGHVKLLRLRGAAGRLDAVVTSADQVLDAASGRLLLERLDIDPNGHYAVSQDADHLFYTAMGDRLAVRFWLDGAGRPAYRPLWFSHYEVTGFFNVMTTAVSCHGLLYNYGQVLERGPHCPCAQVEVNALDVATGRTVARVKPVLENAVNHGIVPAAAGDYVFFCDAGGGSHGGLQGHGQTAAVRAGPEPHLAARNLVDQGTGWPPVFDGPRLYLRGPRAVTCIAVTTDQGRRYEALRLAETLLGQVGPEPKVSAVRTIEPPADYRPGEDVPVVKLSSGEGLAQWLVAAPLPSGSPTEAADAEKVAAMRVDSSGVPLSYGGSTAAFVPLPDEFVRVTGPHYQEYYNLQGRGMRFPSYQKTINPRGILGGLDKVGFFYTVLENARGRVVVSTLDDAGIDVWIGGQSVARGEPVRLRPGLYPLLVRFGPKALSADLVEEPTDVGRALEAGVLKPVAWPTAWKVFGDVPQGSPLLGGEQLAAVPDALAIGDATLTPRTIPLKGLAADLMPLLPIEPPPDSAARHGAPISGEHAAYCFATIEVPADGKLLINSAADWFMAWYLDGKRIYDTLESGNRVAAALVTAHTFSAKVGKGRHVLAVLVRPGSRGWSLTSIGGLVTDRKAPLGVRFPAKGAAKTAPGERVLKPAFREVQDPEDVYGAWRARVRRRESRLRQIVEEWPGTEPARAAEACLRALAERKDVP